MRQKTEVHSETLVVRNLLGLHARTSVHIVMVADLFARHDIRLRNVRDEQFGNAKNALEIMLQAVGQGGSIEIEVTGPRAHYVCVALREILEYDLPRFETIQALLDLKPEDWSSEPELLAASLVQRKRYDLRLWLGDVGAQAVLEDLVRRVPQSMQPKWKDVFRERLSSLLTDIIVEGI